MSQKKKTQMIISLACLIFFFFFGYILLKKGLNNFSIERINFNDKSNVEYKVFLKENNFFEEKYLPRDDKMAYITSLIDYLDVDMNYDLIFDKKSKGEYTYSIKAEISADTQNGNSTYWSKEYVLLEPVTKTFENNSVVNIKENIKIDYQKYNELLTEFKREYSLSINGILRVYLDVDTNVESKIDDKPMELKAITSLEIPLTKATIEVPIDIKAPSNNGVLNSGIIYSKSLIYPVCKIGGIVFMLAGSLSLIYLVLLLVKKGEKTFNYNKEIKHILKTYDGIIVNVSKIPSLEGLKVINVDNFTELLDAHSEVRLPINYCEEKNGAKFVLFNESIAWCYVLEKE